MHKYIDTQRVYVVLILCELSWKLEHIVYSLSIQLPLTVHSVSRSLPSNESFWRAVLELKVGSEVSYNVVCVLVFYLLRVIMGTKWASSWKIMTKYLSLLNCLWSAGMIVWVCVQRLRGIFVSSRIWLYHLFYRSD